MLVIYREYLLIWFVTDNSSISFHIVSFNDLLLFILLTMNSLYLSVQKQNMNFDCFDSHFLYVIYTYDTRKE